MKITKLVIVAVWVVLGASSCVSSRKYKDSLSENSRLNGVLTDFKADTLERGKKYRNLQQENAQLSRKISNLEADYLKLDKNYQQFMQSSMSNTEKLNTALKMQQDELKRKQELLAEREMRLKEFERIIARQDSITNAINNIVKSALLDFKPEELSVQVKEGKIYVSMNDNLLFKSGSASVESKGKTALKLLSGVLGKNENIQVLVEGHTDNVPIKAGTYKDNWDLSVARATSIVRILINENNLEPKRITASGKGEFMPVADNSTSDGRAKNRRTEIILFPDLKELYQLLFNI